MDGDPVVGYRIEQVVCVIMYGLLTFLYMLQALSICWGQPSLDKTFTIRWTAHRLGPISGLMLTLRYIDAHNVFRIYTNSDRLAYFFGNNGSAFLAVLAFSIIYSVIMTNSGIAQLPMPSFLPAGLFLLSILLVIAANLSPALTLSTNNTKYDMIWLVFGSFCCFACLTLLVFSAVPLRRKLQANLINSAIVFKENPDQRRLLESSIKSFDRTIVGSTIIIFAMGMITLIAAATTWNDNRFADPKEFTLSYALSAVFLWIGLLVVLLSVWVPVQLTSTKTGCGWRLMFRSSTLGRKPDSHHSGGTTAGTSGRPGVGGGAGSHGPKPAGSAPSSARGSRNSAIRSMTLTGGDADGGVGDGSITTALAIEVTSPSVVLPANKSMTDNREDETRGSVYGSEDTVNILSPSSTVTDGKVGSSVMQDNDVSPVQVVTE